MVLYRRSWVVDGITPVGAYSLLRQESPEGSFLLESVVPGERWGRYSILGYRPRRRVTLRAGEGDPFAALAAQVPTGGEDVADVAARFAHAHVGLIPYDIVHYATKVPPWPGEPPVLARLLGECTVVVFDNLTHTAELVAHDAEDLERVTAVLSRQAALRPIAPPDPEQLPLHLSVDTSDAEYERIVLRAKEHIRAGDVFQVVPARTFSTEMGAASALDVYRALRVLSPAPYMYLLELPAHEGAEPVSVIGASPETLVRVEERRVTVRPIAGTRRRGRSPEEDEALARELSADPKELAEHLMLIDLARNDIGRVATPGTVRVPVQFAVQRLSHVMHLASEVTGELREGLQPFDVLRATFPAGTLSGAPKVRAMQLIREFEPRPRFAYGGAVGYVTRGTDLDFAIAIRTVVARAGRFEVTAGAGLVADSVPHLEALETRNKARAALAAIAAAEEAARR